MNFCYLLPNNENKQSKKYEKYQFIFEEQSFKIILQHIKNEKSLIHFTLCDARISINDEAALHKSKYQNITINGTKIYFDNLNNIFQILTKLKKKVENDKYCEIMQISKPQSILNNDQIKKDLEIEKMQEIREKELIEQTRIEQQQLIRMQEEEKMQKIKNEYLQQIQLQEKLENKEINQIITNIFNNLHTFIHKTYQQAENQNIFNCVFILKNECLAYLYFKELIFIKPEALENQFLYFQLVIQDELISIDIYYNNQKFKNSKEIIQATFMAKQLKEQLKLVYQQCIINVNHHEFNNPTDKQLIRNIAFQKINLNSNYLQLNEQLQSKISIFDQNSLNLVLNNTKNVFEAYYYKIQELLTESKKYQSNDYISIVQIYKNKIQRYSTDLICSLPFFDFVNKKKTINNENNEISHKYCGYLVMNFNYKQLLVIEITQNLELIIPSRQYNFKFIMKKHTIQDTIQMLDYVNKFKIIQKNIQFINIQNLISFNQLLSSQDLKKYIQMLLFGDIQNIKLSDMQFIKLEAIEKIYVSKLDIFYFQMKQQKDQEDEYYYEEDDEPEVNYFQRINQLMSQEQIQVIIFSQITQKPVVKLEMVKLDDIKQNQFAYISISNFYCNKGNKNNQLKYVYLGNNLDKQQLQFIQLENQKFNISFDYKIYQNQEKADQLILFQRSQQFQQNICIKKDVIQQQVNDIIEEIQLFTLEDQDIYIQSKYDYSISKQQKQEQELQGFVITDQNNYNQNAIQQFSYEVHSQQKVLNLFSNYSHFFCFKSKADNLLQLLIVKGQFCKQYQTFSQIQQFQQGGQFQTVEEFQHNIDNQILQHYDIIIHHIGNVTRNKENNHYILQTMDENDNIFVDQLSKTRCFKIYQNANMQYVFQEMFCYKQQIISMNQEQLQYCNNSQIISFLLIEQDMQNITYIIKFNEYSEEQRLYLLENTQNAFIQSQYEELKSYNIQFFEFTDLQKNIQDSYLNLFQKYTYNIQEKSVKKENSNFVQQQKIYSFKLNNKQVFEIVNENQVNIQLLQYFKNKDNYHFLKNYIDNILIQQEGDVYLFTISTQQELEESRVFYYLLLKLNISLENVKIINLQILTNNVKMLMQIQVMLNNGYYGVTIKYLNDKKIQNSYYHSCAYHYYKEKQQHLLQEYFENKLSDEGIKNFLQLSMQINYEFFGIFKSECKEQKSLYDDYMKFRVNQINENMDKCIDNSFIKVLNFYNLK